MQFLEICVSNSQFPILQIFQYYPSLTRSRCCTKGICTECFLQMKSPNSTRPTQCPFCKTLNYAVEYSGVKTKEEKGQEQIEEQRVIEAKIRLRQQEIQNEEERMLKRQEMSLSGRVIEPGEADYFSRTTKQDIVSVPNPSTIRHPSCNREIRDDEFDPDPENIMLMEAIWLSFNFRHKHKRHNTNYGDAAKFAKYATEVRVLASMAPQASSSASSSSPSGGLACAVATLAECKHKGGELYTNYNNNEGNLSTYNAHLDHSHSQTGLLSVDNHLQIYHDTSEDLPETGYEYDDNLRTAVDHDDDDNVSGG
ncbi:hypothetical protein R6Q57_030038, partial [Mikania cordata]